MGNEDMLLTLSYKARLKCEDRLAWNETVFNPDAEQCKNGLI